MMLNISYVEMAFLRELVNKEKMRIWKEEWLPRLTCKDEEIREIFKEWDEKVCIGHSFGTGKKQVIERVPLNDLDCCRLLQSKFISIENTIQAELSK